MIESPFSLVGKRVLVTGASAGLGRYFAEVLAKAGAGLLLVARRADALDAAANTLGRDVDTFALDITDPASLSAFEAYAHTVDVLVNNAGVVREAPALDVAEDDWDVVMDTNLKGLFRLTQLVAGAMRKRGAEGNIINVASILGLRQAGGVLPYSVSKAGVIQMTKLLALELARYNIRVNALAPGYIGTDLNRDFWDTDAGRALVQRVPQRRLGKLGDLDGPLLLLASDASRYMTGSVLTVDGGHLVSSL